MPLVKYFYNTVVVLCNQFLYPNMLNVQSPNEECLRVGIGAASFGETFVIGVVVDAYSRKNTINGYTNIIHHLRMTFMCPSPS
jgi:hypothetical protein